MSVLAPPPSPTPSHLDAVLSDSDINLDRLGNHTAHRTRLDMPSKDAQPSLKRKPSQQTPLSDVENQQPDSVVETNGDSPLKQAPAKKAKTDATLVELKNGKLHFKQKPLNWLNTMPVMKAMIEFQTFLSGAGKLEEIPDAQLHVVAKLVQESDKSVNELAKAVRNSLMPEADLQSDESQGSSSSSSKPQLSISTVAAAIEKVAERRNYGLDGSHIASASSGSTSGDVTIPTGLQWWRWEVQDSSLLPAENLEKILIRRKEREDARAQATALFASLAESERQALLKKKGRATASAAKETAVKASNAASEPIIIEDDGSDGFVETGTTNGQTPSNPRKRQKSKDSSTPATPASSQDMAGASASGSPKKKASPKVEHSPEKQREKEEKEAAKAERLKAQQVKKAEKEAKEASRALAREAKAAELQKERKIKQKQASFLTSFMQKAQTKSPQRPALTTVASSSKSDFDRTFLPCQYKDLAPVNRFLKPQHDIDMAGDELTKDQLLADLKQKFKAPSGPPRPKGVHPPVSVREVKRIVTESDVLGGNAEEIARKALDDLKDRRKVPIKVLCFVTDRRPGWLGTWTKSTNLISPRCPLSQDPVALDYNYDSDADWEEPGLVDGDDVQEADDREESAVDSDEDSEMDDWLVDDLEVEEEDEAMPLPDDDGDIVEVDAQGRPMLPPKGTRARSRELSAGLGPSIPAAANVLKPKKKKVKLLGRRFDSKLVPFSTGPHWEMVLAQPEYEHFHGYQIEFLNDACFGLNPFTFQSVPEEDQGVVEAVPTSVSSSLLSSPTKSSSSKPPMVGGVLEAFWHAAKPDTNGLPGLEPATGVASTGSATGLKHTFPETEVPALLRAIEGSTKTRPGLVDDLKELFEPLGKQVSKMALNERLAFYAAKEGKKAGAAWRVKEEYRGLAGL